MREIKFRGWCGNRLMTVDIIDQTNRVAYGLVEDIQEGEDSSEIPFESLEQFTGRYDRDGIEIYEGDIVMYVSSNVGAVGLVVFEEHDCCFNVSDYFNGHNDFPTMAFFEGGPFKVIGNIHENPELLEEEAR